MILFVAIENNMYNPFTLINKIILVTGASSGIGRATAIECSRMGATVYLTGRNSDRLHETLSMLEGEGHQVFEADLTKEEDLNALAEFVPVLNGLVNNAGEVKTLPTDFISRSKLVGLMEINTFAPILLFQSLMKKKKILKNASVIFVASVSGIYCAVSGNVLYSTSKGAINGFVKNAALDLARRGIRVNAICPSMIDSRLLDDGAITDSDLEKERNKYPMKRFGRPEEVAHAIIYMLSDASTFTTGSSLLIDGGFTLL